MPPRDVPLDNAGIAELLIREAANAEGHREKAFRRAAHAAMLWPVEAADLVRAGRSLTELPGIGPSLSKRLQQWIDSPPADTKPPANRTEFLTLAQARRILAKDPKWAQRVQGDLQMHTEWSDGVATIASSARISGRSIASDST